MLESTYQAKLIKKLERLFHGCLILKNDANFVQGIPDLLVLYKDMWAVLEVKASERASVGPNQEYWVKRLGKMSFAAFINPQNEERVLRDLQRKFEAGR